MTRKIYILLITFALAVSVKAETASTLLDFNAAPFNNGKWVKIRVNAEGVYQLTPSALAGMGFSDPSKVCMFGNNQPILPEYDIDNEDNDLAEIPLWRREDGSLLFYSKGLVSWERGFENGTFSHTTNPYSKYIYYFLTEGTPESFPSESVAKPSHSTTTFPEHILLDYDEYSLEDMGRTFFENYEYKNGSSKSYTLPTEGISDGIVNLHVRFASKGSATLKYLIDGTQLSSTSYTAPGEHNSAKVTSNSLQLSNREGSSTQFTLSYSTANNCSGYLDYLMYTYNRNLDMNGQNYLAFRTPSDFNYEVKISNANGNTRVWKVTSPSMTKEETGSLSGSTYTANISNDGAEEFVAVNINGTFAEPEVVGNVSSQNLHGLKDINFVIVVPASGMLKSQAQRLADAHIAKDSMTCVVVRADEVYNEFSSGTPDPTAMRRFLRHLKHGASSADKGPKNILLFGAGLFDNRFVTKKLSSNSPDDYLLCYESDNSWSATDSYILEDYYGLIADDAGKKDSVLYDKPEVGVGRIPVVHTVDAKNVVNKLISYINNDYKGSWKNTICMMADDGNKNIHMEDAERVAEVAQKTNPLFLFRKIYWDAYTPTVTTTGTSFPNVYADINKTMTDGALIMNYTGHGAAYTLSHEMVIGTEDFRTWSSPRLPLWITAACDVNPFDRNMEENGTTALLNSRGAAMGFIGTTRTVYSSHNRNLNKNLMKYLLELKDGEQNSIGEALAKAKSDIIGSKRKNAASMAVMNKAHFVLLGDPAIKLAMPTYNTVVDSIGTDKKSDDGTPLFAAGNKVTVTGHIEDEDGNRVELFNGTISPTVFDNEAIVMCKNNEEDADTVFWYKDYNRIIFQGEYDVTDGKFNFQFPVPLDINYSNKPGLINLYAQSDSHEAHGITSDFLVGGTGTLSNDSIGPMITIWLNSDNFNDGDEVNETPWLHVDLRDESGINTTGNGLGHDIVAIIDSCATNSYTLTSYYQQTVGDYTRGTVGFSIPELSEGRHTLTVRAFDLFNNKGEKTISFNVVPGLKPDLFDLKLAGPVRETAKFLVYNNRRGSNIKIHFQITSVTGQVMYTEYRSNEQNNNEYYTFEWDVSSTLGYIPSGVYIAQVGICTQEGKDVKIAKKFAVRSYKEQ